MRIFNLSDIYEHDNITPPNYVLERFVSSICYIMLAALHCFRCTSSM